MTCDFCLFYSLTPMKNIGSDGERMKSFIFSPRYLYIFIIYFSCVLCDTNFFQFVTNTIW